MCRHIIDTNGGRCGQPNVMIEFCGEHAPIYEENKNKIFDKFTVKMVQVNNKREIIAAKELLCGEIIRIYPTL